MNNKKRAIVLYLSEYKEASTLSEYTAPNGKTYSGEQTNDAPMKYLLSNYENVSKIVCITTQRAKDNDLRGRLISCGSLNESVDWVTVDHSIDKNFSETALPDITSEIGKEADTELLLETTGGIRSTVMELLLVSRVLSYTGVNTVGAVYSNFRQKRIEDVTELVRMFDLVGGMQELTGFGNVRTLKKYYSGNGAMEALIESMGELTDLVSLCRTERLDGTIEKVNRALAAVRNSGEQDTVTGLLLPVFREKFGQELTIPGLIRWCVENDMLQQAMTIYVERIPREITKHIDGIGRKRLPIKGYEDWDAVHLRREILSLSLDTSVDIKMSPALQLRNLINNKYKRNDLFEYAFNGGKLRYDPSIRKGVENLCLLMYLAFPERDDLFDPDWRDKLPEDKDFLRQIDDSCWYQNIEEMLDYGMGDSNLCLLLESDSYTLTLQSLKLLLPFSGYKCKDCTDTELKNALQDYIFVKGIRNLTNHANDETTTTLIFQQEYLSRLGYPAFDSADTSAIKTVMLTAVERIMKMNKE